MTFPPQVAFSTRSMSEFVGDFSTNLDEVKSSA